ncbi:hypothetical protein OG373_40450 [Streptomyces avidinii]|uniref:hypothetical protein n=1 Tax=Streptomyces avidinii TaxID=1895 RepID=UPI003866D7CA|nr:hypothetical protein OG373_00715 [Streptomyces avidinii]WTB02135.1 hypothetical protein OG373_40450 [Streptomyces avidinii]
MSALPLNRLSPSAVTDLSALLAACFQQDALTRWMIPGERRRGELLPGFFRVFVELSAAYDGVLTGPDGDAVLLFLPPGAEPDGRALDAAFADVLGEYAEPMRTIAGLQEEAHPHGAPHYYVSFGAVRPGRQQSGLMSGLLGRVVARADADGVGAYVEASSPGGEAAARRAGFRLLGADVALPGGGPVLRPMWRDPR